MEDTSMHATLTTIADNIPLRERFRGAVPYCFILDDAYRVIMAGPANDQDPLANMYEADSPVDVLPGSIDRVVRALSATWRSSQDVSPATAAVSDLQVTVAPLHGYGGRRIAVFVQRADLG